MVTELKEILNNDPGCKYQLQYVDYINGTWTVPLLLTEDRINNFTNDNSLKCVKVTFTDGITLTLY
jgi:hypothetical protein